VANRSQPKSKNLFWFDFDTTQGRLYLLQAAVIVAAVLWIFSPCWNGDWIWDDELYFTHNPLLKDPDRLWKAWFVPGSFIEYYPIEETLQWLQWNLWHHENMLGYHLSNVVLHILSALLVWRLFRKMGLRLAWLGGLLFAVHPVQVESVAWISEFKNVLSLPPFLVALCFWIDYEEHRRRQDYELALGFFLVAMLCKISMVPFPFVILLYAWWKRGKIGWSDIKACLPFLAISLVLGALTSLAGLWYLAHLKQGAAPIDIGGPFSRLALIGLNISFYLSKTIWPIGFLPVYPQWQINPPSPVQFVPWLAFAGAAWFIWRARHGWGRHVALGLGFFLLLLSPFLGLRDISYMNFTWVMDHFLYVPLIGIIGLVVAGLEKLNAHLLLETRSLSTGVTTIVVVLLAFTSHRYASAFTNAETFWDYAVEQNPQAWLAENNLGKVILDDGRPEEAVPHFEAALRTKPDFAEAHTNIGTALFQMRHVPEAIAQFEAALQLDPRNAEAHNNLGIVLAQTGHLPEAIQHFDYALKLKPSYDQAQNNMGNALFVTGHVPEAIAHYRKALEINPDYPEAVYNLGHALLVSGQAAEALPWFNQALQLNPAYLSAHDDLGTALAQLGKIPEALEQFRAALQLDPTDATALSNLAKLQGAPAAAPVGH